MPPTKHTWHIIDRSKELILSVKLGHDIERLACISKKYVKSCLFHSLRNIVAWTPRVLDLLDDVVHCAIYRWMMPYIARTFRVRVPNTEVWKIKTAEYLRHERVRMRERTT